MLRNKFSGEFEHPTTLPSNTTFIVYTSQIEIINISICLVSIAGNIHYSQNNIEILIFINYIEKY